MTNKEAINFGEMWLDMNEDAENSQTYAFFERALEVLKAEPCVDAVSREDARSVVAKWVDGIRNTIGALEDIKALPPVAPKPRLCKDCKFFEYDSVVEVDGIPLIVAHETCKKWGGGCKTEEDGYCFLFEPKMEGASK